MRKSTILLFFAVLVALLAPQAFAQQSIPTLDVPDARLAAQYNWPAWWQRIAPAFQAAVGFPNISTVHITVNTDPSISLWFDDEIDTVIVPQLIFGLKVNST